MNEAARIAVDLLLALVVASCWLGALGMVRMRDAFQALHYLALPALLGIGGVTLAIFIETGWTQAGWKSAIIFIVFALSNSIGTHAAARAFRHRDKQHWEPRADDTDVEFIGSPSPQ